MIFQNVEYQLLLFVVINLLIALYIIFTIKRRRDLRKLGSTNSIEKLINANQFSKTVKFVLILLICILAIVSMMRPKWGSRPVSITKKGFELVFLLDVSPSMSAVDVKPDRLSQAKTVITDIVDKLRGNKFALVQFSGEPTVDPPLTTDVTSFIEFYLKVANTEQIPIKGTIYTESLKLAEELFSKRFDVGKAIIIVSDGEAHDDGANNIAKKLYREKGIITYTIGVGTEEGSFIPQPGGAKKTTRDGKVIKTKLEKDTLIKIAQEGGGEFVLYTGDESLIPIFDSLNRLKKGRLGTHNTEVMKEQYQYFVLIAVLLFILFLFIPGRRIHLNLRRDRK